jgi:hypothetical protein
LTQEGLKNVFDSAIGAVVNPAAKGSSKPPMPPKPAEPSVISKDIHLSRALASLVNKQEFSDVTFILKDKTEMNAHKVILGTGMPSLHKTILQKGENVLPPCFKLREVASKPVTTRTLEVQELASSDRIPLGGQWHYDHWVAPFANTLTRHGLTVFTLNGTAYLVGGADAQGQFVKNMLRFEMSTLPVSSMST